MNAYDYESMSTLYPYAEGITCVGAGKIFKCFPDLVEDEEGMGRTEEVKAKTDYCDGILTVLILAVISLGLVSLLLIG